MKKLTLASLVTAAFLALPIKPQAVPIHPKADNQGWVKTDEWRRGLVVNKRTFDEQKAYAKEPITHQGEEVRPLIWFTYPKDKKPITVSQTIQVDEYATILDIADKIPNESIKELAEKAEKNASINLLLEGSLFISKKALEVEGQVLESLLGSKYPIINKVSQAKKIIQIPSYTKELERNITLALDQETSLDAIRKGILNPVAESFDNAARKLNRAHQIKSEGIDSYEEARDFYANWRGGIIESAYAKALFQETRDNESIAKIIAGHLTEGTSLNLVMSSFKENGTDDQHRERIEKQLEPLRQQFAELEAPFKTNPGIYLYATKGIQSKTVVQKKTIPKRVEQSLDNTRIAYSFRTKANTSELHLFDYNGEWDIELIGNREGSIKNIQWDPKGRKIYFIDEHGTIRRKPRSLCSINPDGSNFQTLFTEHIFDDQIFNVAISPSGRQIAVTSYKTDAGDLYLFDANGSDERRLTREMFHDIRSPSWSPDGNKIIFTGEKEDRYGFPTNLDIFIINSDGSNLENLTATKNSSESKGLFLTKDSIAFKRNDYSGIFDLREVSIDGKRIKKIGKGVKGNFEYEVYLPFQKILTYSLSDLSYEVLIGREKEILIDKKLSSVSFSPDGSKIVGQISRDDIAIIDIATGGNIIKEDQMKILTKLPGDLVYLHDIAWSPYLPELKTSSPKENLEAVYDYLQSYLSIENHKKLESTKTEITKEQNGYRINIIADGKGKYLVNATPIKYGTTGIDTIIINDSGIIRHKDNKGKPGEYTDSTGNNTWPMRDF